MWKLENLKWNGNGRSQIRKKICRFSEISERTCLIDSVLFKGLCITKAFLLSFQNSEKELLTANAISAVDGCVNKLKILQKEDLYKHRIVNGNFNVKQICIFNSFQANGPLLSSQKIHNLTLRMDFRKLRWAWDRGFLWRMTWRICRYQEISVTVLTIRSGW